LQNAGAVIGKGGSNIKRLRQDVSHYYCFFSSSFIVVFDYKTVFTSGSLLSLGTFLLTTFYHT